MSDACSVRANWLCRGWPFCLAEMRREFQTGGNFFCTTLYVRLFLQGARHLPKEAAHPAGHRDEPREPRLPRTRVQGAPPDTDLPHQLQVCTVIHLSVISFSTMTVTSSQRQGGDTQESQTPEGQPHLHLRGLQQKGKTVQCIPLVL